MRQLRKVTSWQSTELAMGAVTGTLLAAKLTFDIPQPHWPLMPALARQHSADARATRMMRVLTPS